MNPYLLAFGFLAVVFSMHELGHFIFAKWYNAFNGFSLHWYGAFEVGVDNSKVTIIEKLNISLAGIFLGYFPVLLLKSPIWHLLYLSICIGDILFILAVLYACFYHGFSFFENVESILIRYQDGIL